MEPIAHGDRSGFLHGVSERIHSLSTSAQSSATRLIRRLAPFAGLGWLLAALVCGLLAHNADEAKIASTWLREHYPSSLIWEAALRVRGFSPAPTRLRSKLLARIRYVPSEGDSDPASEARTDPNLEWIAVRDSRQGGAFDWVFYCNGLCQAPPTAFESSGRAWEGFEKLMERLDHRPKKPIAHPEPQDPRALRY